MIRPGLARFRLQPRFRVLVVESHDLVRLGLCSLLAAHRSLEVVGQVPTLAAALAVVSERHPHLVVLAATLPHGGALEGCREILARAPDTRVVILGGRADDGAVRAAVRAGALGWLSRHGDPSALCRALRDAAAGALRSTAEDPPGRDVLALTPQERRVLGLVAHGKTNKEIGNRLGLSEKTVKNYLSHAFEKLSVSRRAQAAVLFTRRYGGGPDAETTGDLWTAGPVTTAVMTGRAAG